MEKYTINGVEVEYDTFDLDDMERLEAAVAEVRDGVEAIQSRRTEGESSVALLREQANLFLDFFDDVIGEGTAEKLFGNRVNIMVIAKSYTTFIKAVAEKRREVAGELHGHGTNREQRRAAKRKREA